MSIFSGGAGCSPAPGGRIWGRSVSEPHCGCVWTGTFGQIFHGVLLDEKDPSKEKQVFVKTVKGACLSGPAPVWTRVTLPTTRLILVGLCRSRVRGPGDHDVDGRL